MDYNGNYSELVYELANKLEDAATVPALTGGYPAVALLEEWQRARKNLAFMHKMGMLTDLDLNEAESLLAGTAEEYLSQLQDDFENSLERN